MQSLAFRSPLSLSVFGRVSPLRAPQGKRRGNADGVSPGIKKQTCDSSAEPAGAGAAPASAPPTAGRKNCRPADLATGRSQGSRGPSSTQARGCCHPAGAPGQPRHSEHRCRGLTGAGRSQAGPAAALGWAGPRASTDTHEYQAVMVPGVLTHCAPPSSRRTLRGNTPVSGGGRVTMNKNKWALFGVAFFYLLEQMYSASFSAFPQCSPSVSRPILFTGKQQDVSLYTATNVPLFLRCLFNIQT